VTPSILIEPKENSWKRTGTSRDDYTFTGQLASGGCEPRPSLNCCFGRSKPSSAR
jgi:hypothetical protein